MSDATPAYKSDTCFGVVIRGETYLGWSAPDVGNGRMRFTHPDLGEFRVNKGLSTNWMEECWDDFVEFAQRVTP